MKRIAALAMCLLMLTFVFVGCNQTPPDNEEALSFTVVVKHLDGTEKTFEYSSTKATLGDALLEKGLIEGYESKYGLTITTVDGVYYDWEASNTYWSLLINGEYAMTGADSTYIVEGNTYSLVATTY